MQKQCMCIIMTKDEAKEACGANITFSDHRLTSPAWLDMLENYTGYVIISVMDSPRDDNEFFMFIAPGYTQVNPMSGKRIKMLNGTVDEIKDSLLDIFKERYYEDPYDIFHEYSFACPIREQFELNDWIKELTGH